MCEYRSFLCAYKSLLTIPERAARACEASNEAEVHRRSANGSMAPVARGSVLQCCSIAVCCSVLRCVAICCSGLQCVAICCSVMQCVAVCGSVLQCVAVCCSVLQCVAVCCSA